MSDPGDRTRASPGENPREAAAATVPLSEAPTTARDELSSATALPDVPGYRILRLIGEGGMGAVYEAEQDTPRRHVALKVIRTGGYVTEEQVRLFRREIESLGRLNHPSIAAIHDAGRTPFGQHYFAMELVQGKRLDRWLREVPPGHSERDFRRVRLQLFAEICDAIQYAHQRGVVHRDLKPSNIFVTDRTGSSGVPGIKVLDFGLARITDADISLTTIASEMGRIRGTLAYMSPEQARGDPNAIDSRTDIYSLGVILYELLTSERPYDVRRRLVPEAVRIILEEDPRRPSTVMKTLRGDLETITLKALEKDPDRRYPSVSALADDVRRSLSGQTILARPPSTMYQVQKLVARHKAPVTLLAVIFVLLIAATVTMSVLYEGQRRERARAETEARKAERTSTFLQDMLASIAPDKAKGREVTVREVLDGVSGSIARELADEPEVRAQIESTIGVTYFALGHEDEALAHQESAIDIRRTLFGEDDWRTAEAKLVLARLLRNQGDVVRSGALTREAVDACRRGGRPAVATLLTGLIELARVQGASEGHPREAEATAREALELCREVHDGDHAEVASALHQLGLRLMYLDEADSAEVYLLSAGDMLRRLGEPSEAQLASVLVNLGLFYARIDSVDRAERAYREALEIRRRVHGDNHPTVALILHNLASLRAEQGDVDTAVDYLRQVVRIGEVLYEDEHLQLAVFRINLGEGLEEQGNLDEAKILFRKASEVVRESSPWAWWPLSDLVRTCLATGDPIEAESAARRALAAMDGWAPADHWIRGAARIQLGFCLGKQKRFAEAEPYMVEGDSLMAAAASDWPLRDASQDLEDRRTALERLATFYESWGRSGRAQPYRDRLASLTQSL